MPSDDENGPQNPLLQNIIVELQKRNLTELIGIAYELLRDERCIKKLNGTVEEKTAEIIRQSLKRHRSENPISLSGFDIENLPSSIDEDEEENIAPHPHSSDVYKRAMAEVKTQGSETTKRNLEWLYRRDSEEESTESIAKAYGVSEEAVRGGIKRVIDEIKFRVGVIETRYFAPYYGARPEKIGEIENLIQEADNEQDKQKIIHAENELTNLKEEYSLNPYWMNASGKVCLVKGEYPTAISWFKEGLAYADTDALRATLLNNWGYAEEALGNEVGAKQQWTRADQIAPDAVTPLLNLTEKASKEHNLTLVEYYLSVIYERLRRNIMSKEQRQFLIEKLRDPKVCQWAKSRKAWTRLKKLVSLGIIALMVSLSASYVGTIHEAQSGIMTRTAQSGIMTRTAQSGIMTRTAQSGIMTRTAQS